MALATLAALMLPYLGTPWSGYALAAIFVGMIDTLGRAYGPQLLRMMMEPAAANQTGRSLAPMLIYILMATVLFVRPSGPFPVKR